jgi:hypothetical protein
MLRRKALLRPGLTHLRDAGQRRLAAGEQVEIETFLSRFFADLGPGFLAGIVPDRPQRGGLVQQFAAMGECQPGVRVDMAVPVIDQKEPFAAGRGYLLLDEVIALIDFDRGFETSMTSNSPMNWRRSS